MRAKEIAGYRQKKNKKRGGRGNKNCKLCALHPPWGGAGRGGSPRIVKISTLQEQKIISKDKNQRTVYPKKKD